MTVTAPASADGPGILVEVPGAAPVVVAVIASAVNEVWPRPHVSADGDRDAVPAWRFSGRWWSRPATVRRDRPRT